MGSAGAAQREPGAWSCLVAVEAKLGGGAGARQPPP